MATPAAKPAKPPPKPTNVKFCRAAFAFQARDPEELTFQEGDLLYIIDDKSDKDWWKARCRGKEGLVPSNYLASSSTSDSATSLTSALTPMHDACRRGNLELLEECLLNRVPVNATDNAGNTPLHWAAYAGQLECLQRLLSIPQIAKSPKNRLGDTPLHQAAWKGHPECIKLLREAGATYDIENEEGKKPADLAKDTDTKAEFQLWSSALKSNFSGNSVGGYAKNDYGDSGEEDED